MIFHVVAIKELFEKKYTVDLLFFWLSEEKIREIMHEYKLVTLELYEYPKNEVEAYWIIKILINYEWEEIRLLTNVTELEDEIYLLSLIWFDVKNINYVSEEKKIEQNAINAVLDVQKWKAKTWLKEQAEAIEQNKLKEEKIFDDQKLEKSQKLAKELLEKIPIFLEKAKDTISNNDLKELHNEMQELSKLEMWSNVEKITTFLESVYSRYSTLEQEYLAIQESPSIEILWSNISDAYLVSELTKLEKAKSLQKLWWAKKWDDMLYAILWWILLYFRLIKRDIKTKLKDFSLDFSKIFGYLSLSFFIITLLSALYISFINKNDFVFVIMIYSGVFWLVLYGIKSIKPKKILYNTLLLIWSTLVSILIIWLLWQIFIF